MWLIVTFIAALLVTAIHFGAKDLKKYKLDFLALMLWGTFIMVLVDHAIAFFREGGEFIEATTEGLVTNSAILGLLMLLPLLAIWVVVICTRFGSRICTGCRVP